MNYRPEKVEKARSIVEKIGGYITGIEENFIWVDGNVWTIVVDREKNNTIVLGFHADCDPGLSAKITKELLVAIQGEFKDIIINESYNFVVGENGEAKIIWESERMLREMPVDTGVQ